MPDSRDKHFTVSQKRKCPRCLLELEPSITVCPQDGTELVASMKPGAMLAQNYQLLATIGAGGMGVIYKAKQLTLNKTVAIKMIHTHLSTPQALQRFQQEGKALSNLSHPNIIAVHDLGVTDNGDAYMVMDYCDGRTLSEVLKQDGPLTVEAFLHIFLQVCDALAHAHAKGILHRDVKPSNIMLTLYEDGQDEVKILDFGVAKLMEAAPHEGQNLTKTGEAVGSPLYMSPEQSLGKRIDQRADLYSLGCVMYEALVGVSPFEGSTAFDTMMKHVNDAPLPLAEVSLGHEFPSVVETIVMRLLAKSPDDRYQSMEEVKKDLLAAQWNVRNQKKLMKLPVTEKLNKKAPNDKAFLWHKPSLTNLILLSIALIEFAVIACNWSKIWAPPVAPSLPAPPAYVPKSDVAIFKSMIDSHQPTIKCYSGHPLQLRDEDLKLLRGAKFVKELSLDSVPINGSGLKYLADLPIATLDLSNTLVNDDGLLNVKSLPKLTELLLEKTKITNKSIPLLESLRSLRHLIILNCGGITDPYVFELHKSLPDCQIEPPPEDIAGDQSKLANYYKRRKQYAPELAKRKAAIEWALLIKAPSEKAQKLKEITLDAAVACDELKDYNQADKYWQQALEQWRLLSKPEGDVPFYAAQHYIKTRRYKEAEPLLLDALAIDERRERYRHEDLSDQKGFAWSALAQSYLGQNEFAKARGAVNTAKSFYQKAGGENLPVWLAGCSNDLAAIATIERQKASRK